MDVVEEGGGKQFLLQLPYFGKKRRGKLASKKSKKKVQNAMGIKPVICGVAWRNRKN